MTAAAPTPPFPETDWSLVARLREDLSAALEGSLGRLEEQYRHAVGRVRELEDEREEFAARVRALEARVTERVAAFDVAEQRLRADLEDRERRVHELEETHARWQERIAALSEIRLRLDDLLS